MSSDIVLTSALRTNLLSLQNTQRLIDSTQEKLATGLKVNSALDNPQSFFTAQSLNNRASDLSRLLDGIGQSIRTIEAADNGVTALTDLVEQAQAIVSSARDELAQSEGEARLSGAVDLSETADLTTLANIDTGDQFDIITTDSNGQQISQTITITTGDTGASLAAQITNAFADLENGEIIAGIASDGTLSIESSDGRSFRIEDNAVNTTTLAGFTDLGIGAAFEDEVRGAVTIAATTVVAGNTLEAISLFESSGNTADAGDLITGSYIDADGNDVLSGFQVGDTIDITVNNSATDTTSITVTATTSFQDVVDQINQDPNINQLVEASFNTNTGVLNITSLSDTVENVNLDFVASAVVGTRNFDIGLGDPTGRLDPTTFAAGETSQTVFNFNNSTEALDQLASDYNTLRSQIDEFVADASYRGINLLNGDSLNTFFNENNSSSLTTDGQIFTANGLGITEATFRSSTEIETSAVSTREALEAVRGFGRTLANDLSIIETRQRFTESTINTLESGADDLTVADANEEGANLLALQTRQALGTTALSLASQSAQSVLRLF